MSDLGDAYRAMQAPAAVVPATPVPEPTNAPPGDPTEAPPPPSAPDGAPIPPVEPTPMPPAEDEPAADTKGVDIVARWEAKARRELASREAEGLRRLESERARIADEARAEVLRSIRANPVKTLREAKFTDDEIVQVGRENYYGVVGEENAPKEYKEAMEIQRLRLENKRLEDRMNTWEQNQTAAQMEYAKMTGARARLAEAGADVPFVKAESAADTDHTARRYIALAEHHHAAGDLDGFRSMAEARKWLLGKLNEQIQGEVEATKTRHSHAFGVSTSPTEKAKAPPPKLVPAAPAVSSPSVEAATRIKEAPKTPAELKAAYHAILGKR